MALFSKGSAAKYFLPIATSVLFIVLIGIAIFNAMFTSKEYVADLIAGDVKRLSKIFSCIDRECKILSLEYQKNPINFLNVKEFSGSEIGPMNLAHPEKWEGPYLEDNPTMQEKEYLIVRTKKGYFITPGEGVILPNGKQVGTDIILDENADIAAMAKDPDLLLFKGKSLAAPLSIGTSVSEREAIFSLEPLI